MRVDGGGRYASGALSDVLVLCYHAVSPAWPSALAVTPDQLERHLGLLVHRGYVGATFHDAVHAPPAPRTLAVTFDDAYRSVVTYAAPILDRFGLPGTIFVPTAFPGTPDEPMAWPGIDEWLDTPHRDELLPASWDELRGLAARGWEMGGHTRVHPHLPELDDDDLAEELSTSRVICEEAVGAPCRTIAYPYGDQDERVRRAARAAGYTAAAALDRWMVTGDPMRFPRVGLYPPDDGLRYRLKVAPLVRRLRSRRGAADKTGR